MDATTHSNPGGYCNKCYGLFSTIVGLEALITFCGYKHHNGAEAKASAARGCPLCRRLLMKWPDGLSKDTDELVCWAARGGCRCQARLTGRRQEVHVSSVPYVFDGLICFRHGGGESTHQRFVKTFTLFAAADDKAAALLPIRPPVTNVGSHAGLQIARRLLQTCLKDHVSCRSGTGTKEPPPLLPTRVVDIGAGNNKSVKLHVSSPGECGPYVALSYCWGGPQPVMLTENTQSLMMEKILYDELPKTIKDAIQVTRSLGLRYLWVDALCIVQDDNSPSKFAELGQMGKLYKNATVTIFASAASAVPVGFLKSRPVPAVWTLPLLCPDGSLGTAQLAIGERHQLMHPLDTRGWTMQECLLSRRKLIYGSRELVWECETSAKATFPASYLEPVWSFRWLPLETFTSSSVVFTPEKAATVWRDMVDEYTKRKLSHVEDRLNAVAGLATELQPVFQDECIFGLWRKNFIRQLCWSRRGLFYDEEKNRVLQCAPEWSWASRYFHVNIESCTPEDEEDWKLLSDNRVVLHRRLKRGHDIPFGPSRNWEVMLDFRESGTENKAFIPTFCLQHEGHDVFYFILGHYKRLSSSDIVCELTMAVVRAGPLDTFRRVGIVKNESGSSWFEGLPKQKVILM